MRLAVDMASIMKTCMYAGIDIEGYDVMFEGKKQHVNTAAYGYENVVNHLVSTLLNWSLTPKDMIFVFEGISTKSPRLSISGDYKGKRRKYPPESNFELEEMQTKLVETFSSLGTTCLTQDYAEGDDTLGFLAYNTESDLVIDSYDNDLSVLNLTNKYGAKVQVSIGGVTGENKYGDFPTKYITVYKALVGDTTDSITGVKGFGIKAWEALYAAFGNAGLSQLHRMAIKGNVYELGEDLSDPIVKKIFDGNDDFIKSYALAKIHPEWVNTMAYPLQFKAGLINGVSTDERLKRWCGNASLVTASNYNKAAAFLQANLDCTDFFSVDLETSVGDESEEWLEGRSKGKGVDVIGSKITGGSISFGANLQYAYYVTVDHIDSDNVSLEQFAALLSLIPPHKITCAHNAAGFELPVLYNHFSQLWVGNGWRGFYPNMVDTRIAASFWDENAPSHGLKNLAKELFGYEQQTYDDVTGGLRMNQITADKVVSYGCDDVYVSSALWNYFKLIMELEHTYKPFMLFEQKPMYLQALSYCQGIKLDMAKLSELSRADDVAEISLKQTLDKYLVDHGWEGTVLPVVSTITPADIKYAVSLCGAELVTMVRTLSKIAALVGAMEFEGATTLASIVKAEDVESFNAFIKQRWVGRPELNTGSPKQLQALLYDTMGATVRLRNRPTETMRAKGIREGSPRTDDDAMNMAVKLGDVTGEVGEVLKALIEIKSIGTRRGLYWTAYPKFLHWSTGKLHPELRQSATNTRRYTGNSPNIQQMESSEGGVRSVILAHHRNAVVVSLDESGQEVRQMADYAKDKNLLTCYLGTPDQLRDVHSIVASTILKCTYEEFRRRLKNGSEEEMSTAAAMRQKAKVVLFASLYGASAPKIAEGLGIEEHEAQSYIDAIYIQFPDVKKWKETTESIARTEGNVTIHGGTIRHLGRLVLSEDSYTASKAMRQAGNARIQAAGGNQIKRIMGRIWDSNLLDDYDYRWYFSVHDETVSSVSKEHAVDVIRILHGFMTEQFLDIVPSASSIGIGKSFGGLKELGETFDADLLAKTLDELFPPRPTLTQSCGTV